MSKVIIKPIITEKMTEAGEKLNRFGFIVDKRANKLQIKEAVEKMYSVSVDSVRTMINTGKIKSRNTKAGIVSGRVGNHKRAIVSLKEGDTIDLYSSI